MTAKTVLRGGWGVSYAHNQRTGAADLLPINGPQVINAVVNQTNAADPSFRPTEQGYPGRPDGPLAFQSAGGRTSPTFRATIARAASRAGSRRCSASCCRTCWSTLPTSATTPTTWCSIANYNQAVRQQCRRVAVAAGAAADPGVLGHHLRLQRRQVALPRVPDEVRVADARRDAPQLADAVAGEGQRRPVAREPERQLPRPAGLQQPRGRVRHRRLRPALQHHHELRVGAAVRARPAVGRQTPARRWTPSSAAGSCRASTR